MDADATISGSGLPLREALMRWCNPLLVQRIQLLEEIVTIAKTRELGRPRLSNSSGNQQRWNLPQYAGVVAYEGVINPRKVLAATWTELELDFRQRIERGEINLAGVSVWPLRETERRKIPNHWAADLWFDFSANRVNVVQFQYSTHSYVAVMASLRPHVARLRAETSSGPKVSTSMAVLVEHPTAVAEEEDEDSANSAADPTPPKRKDRGRMNYGPLIEAVLRENWDDIVRRYPPPTKPVWAEVARMLHGRMTKRHARNPQAIVPQLDTFRTNLPDIYAKVLSEKAELNKSAQ